MSKKVNFYCQGKKFMCQFKRDPYGGFDYFVYENRDKRHRLFFKKTLVYTGNVYLERGEPLEIVKQRLSSRLSRYYTKEEFYHKIYSLKNEF